MKKGKGKKSGDSFKGFIIQRVEWQVSFSDNVLGTES